MEKTTDKLYDIMLYRVNLDIRLTWTHNFNGNCIGRCKANYHTITTTTAPTLFRYMIIHGRSKWKQNKNKRNKKHSNFLCSMLTNLFWTWGVGTYKVRNEIETKRNETKRNEINKNETKRNETKSTKWKRNKTKPTKAKRNQRKQNEIRC